MSRDILRALHAHLHCNTMDNGQHTETKISWWMNRWTKCECVHLSVVGCYPLSLTAIPTFNREAVMTSEALKMEPVDFPPRRRKWVISLDPQTSSLPLLSMSFHASCSGSQSILHVKCGSGSIHPCASGEVVIHAGERFCGYTFALEVTCDPVRTPPSLMLCK